MENAKPMMLHFHPEHLQPGSLTNMVPDETVGGVIFSSDNPAIPPLTLGPDHTKWLREAVEGPLRYTSTSLAERANDFTRILAVIEPGSEIKLVSNLDQDCYELEKMAEEQDRRAFSRYDDSANSDISDECTSRMKQSVVKLAMNTFGDPARLVKVVRLGSDCDDAQIRNGVYVVLSLVIKGIRHKYLDAARTIVAGGQPEQTSFWGPVAKLLLEQNFGFSNYVRVYKQRLARYRWYLAARKADKIGRRRDAHDSDDPDHEVDSQPDVDLEWWDGEDQCTLPNPEYDRQSRGIELIKYMYDLIILSAIFEANLSPEQVKTLQNDGLHEHRRTFHQGVGNLVTVAAFPMVNHAYAIVASRQGQA